MKLLSENNILIFIVSLILISCSENTTTQPVEKEIDLIEIDTTYNYFPITLGDTLKFDYLQTEISSSPITIKYLGISSWNVSNKESINDSTFFSVFEKIVGEKITETVIDDPNNWHIDTAVVGSFSFEKCFNIIQFGDSMKFSLPGYFPNQTFQFKFKDLFNDVLIIEESISTKFYLRLNKGFDFYFSQGVGGNNYTNYELKRIY